MSALRRALGVVSLRWKDPIACEACGGDFKCGATLTGCWCMAVKLTADTRASLRRQYKNCLCRSCLEREAARGGM
jgi:cysteine-rich CWC protein